MADDTDFKEPFNWWYLLLIVLALLVPLTHIVAGWFVFFFSK